MKNLALNLPGGETINNSASWFPDLASLISPLLRITFYIAAFLAFYFLIWGAYQYILASGNKENLAKARARITWALIGLMVVLMAYFIAVYASSVFPPNKGGVPF